MNIKNKLYEILLFSLLFGLSSCKFFIKHIELSYEKGRCTVTNTELICDYDMKDSIKNLEIKQKYNINLDCISDLNNLTDLTFIGSHDYEIEKKQIRRFKKLKRLIFFSEHSKRLPNWVYNCNELSELYIDKVVKIDTFHFNQISKLTNLNALVLYLDKYKSDYIPSEIYNLKKLKFLTIRLTDNRLISELNKLNSLTNITFLELPIDLSKQINILKEMPQLNELIVCKFSDIEKNYYLLKEFKKLHRLTINQNISFEVIQKILNENPYLKISTPKWTSYGFHDRQ